MNDDLFNYLVATDQLDEFLGNTDTSNDSDDIEEDDENEDY